MTNSISTPIRFFLCISIMFAVMFFTPVGQVQSVYGADYEQWEDCDWDGYDDHTGVKVPWPGFDGTRGDTPSGPSATSQTGKQKAAEEAAAAEAAKKKQAESTTTAAAQNSASAASSSGSNSSNKKTTTKSKTKKSSANKTISGDSAAKKDTKENTPVSNVTADKAVSSSGDKKNTTSTAGQLNDIPVETTDAAAVGLPDAKNFLNDNDSTKSSVDSYRNKRIAGVVTLASLLVLSAFALALSAIIRKKRYRKLA